MTSESTPDHDPVPAEISWGPSPLTIVWGVLLVVCAALGAGYAFLGLIVDPVLVGALVVVGCGVFLVAAAVLTGRRRSG